MEADGGEEDGGDGVEQFETIRMWHPGSEFYHNKLNSERRVKQLFVFFFL